MFGYVMRQYLYKMGFRLQLGRLVIELGGKGKKMCFFPSLPFFFFFLPSFVSFRLLLSNPIGMPSSVSGEVGLWEHVYICSGSLKLLFSEWFLNWL